MSNWLRRVRDYQHPPAETVRAWDGSPVRTIRNSKWQPRKPSPRVVAERAAEIKADLDLVVEPFHRPLHPRDVDPFTAFLQRLFGTATNPPKRSDYCLSGPAKGDE